STGALIGACVGAAFFVLGVAAVTCFCYRRRFSHSKLPGRRCSKPEPMRRPTAVRNTGAPGPLLKKSPSPTGSKSPPTDTPSNSKEPFSDQQQKKGDPELKENEHVVKFFLEKEKEEVSKEEEDREKSDFEKSISLGRLYFRLKFLADKSALTITIERCSHLPSRELTSSDPYVKLQLLPDKQHKVKTRVLRKTRDPVYDEDFTFYGITSNQLSTITLHFVVLSFDRYSRDDVIGEVICPLSGVQLKDNAASLNREICPRDLKIRTQGRGELLVSLCYQPAANRLTVVVLKASNLPKMDITGLSDPYVKIYLLYNNQRFAKKKTHVKKRTLNPIFNESFVFEVPNNEGLGNVSLEFLVLDWDRVTKNEVIGRLEMGANSHGSALHHWNEVCSAPRRQIAEWHKLRE
uniref:C2 domain-containing protein n=1 Tax=Strigamia maritima TaxID=126957 RepID=T1JDZ3_STRMM